MTPISRLFDFPYYQLEKNNLPDCLVTKYEGKWVKTSTQQYIDKANAVSRALLRLGVLENDAKATFRDSLLIFGAGGVGMLLIKLAKFIGIREIVVVDIHEEKLSYAINLGSSSTVRFSTKAETMLNLNKIFAGRAPTIAIVPCLRLVKISEFSFSLICLYF